jgi:hypothetical protein
MTVVTNDGNADVWPVLHVHGGGANSWTITNNSVLDDDGNPLVFSYDPLPIGPAFAIPPGDYAILDMFRNKIELASSGADMTAGIEHAISDFWPLRPGSNNITKTGGMTVEILRPVTGWA